ncbi:MAG TPA: NAD(P)/FAD-dependent oxidoreductase [Pseudonocardiaceae bacterium]|nr:NAD(P)/FAD-dependent oxidoreductase [Pseudonocardiaceae bacterium]
MASAARTGLGHTGQGLREFTDEPGRARPRIVVLGAGFAGLNAARALRRVDADVTLLDKNNYHTFQPLLYQVSTGYLPPEEVGAALRTVFRRQSNLTVRLGELVAVDWTQRVLHCRDGSTVGFDYLILAAGAQTNFFGVPGMREYSWPLYTLTDAVRLRQHLLSILERSAQHAGPGAGRVPVIVVGGGPTGVETAGALSSMARELVGPAAKLAVTLLEAGPRLLGGLSPRSSQRALIDLSRRGVTVRLNQRVAAADAHGVTLASGERLATDTVIWAAGVQANDLSRALGVDLNHHGQIIVDAELQVPDHPGVFVAGDLAASPPAAPHERGLPMLAPVAIQSGRHAGEQLTRLIQGQPLKTFGYRDKGVMAVLGRGDAVAELPLWSRSAGHYRLKFGGLVAWLLWLGVHIVYLISFRNRLQVLIDWAWNYFTSRGAGAILLDPPEQAPRNAPTPSPPTADSLTTAKPLLPGHDRREDR